MDGPIRVSEEVRSAKADGRAVVALETSVVAHGLPAPTGIEAARRMAAAVRRGGAVPAFIAVLGGRWVVGAGDADLGLLADPARPVAKVQARDLAAMAAAGRDGGTTVSATVALASAAGIRVIATGGIGGVHRRAPGEPAAVVGDVSADLDEVARRRVCVVSAGPKAVLDVPATAEALETRGVPVIGFGTGEMPAFYAGTSGIALEHRLDDPAKVAEVLRLHWSVLERDEGVLLFVPPPRPVPREVVEAAVADGLADAAARGVAGKAVTPFLLEAVARATGGHSREANVALLERNAEVAAAVAVALAGGGALS